MAPHVLVPRHNIMYLCIAVIAFAVVVSSETISDLRLCADPKCEGTISFAQVLAPYRSNDPIFLSFKRGDLIAIKSKSAGKRPDLWGGELNGNRGYFPKAFVREIEVQIDEPSVTVPTEKQVTVNEKVMGMKDPQPEPPTRDHHAPPAGEAQSPTPGGENAPPPGEQTQPPPTGHQGSPPTGQQAPPPGERLNVPPNSQGGAPPSPGGQQKPAEVAVESQAGNVEVSPDQKQEHFQQELKFESKPAEPAQDAGAGENVVEMTADDTKKPAEKDETEVEEETELDAEEGQAKPKERNPYDLDDIDDEDDTEIPDEEEDKADDSTTEEEKSTGGFFSESEGSKSFEQGLRDLHDTFYDIDNLVSERNKAAGGEGLTDYLSNALGGGSEEKGTEKPVAQETPTSPGQDASQPPPAEAPAQQPGEGTPQGGVPPSQAPMEGTPPPAEQPAVQTEQPSPPPQQATGLPVESVPPTTQPELQNVQSELPPQQQTAPPQQSVIPTDQPAVQETVGVEEGVRVGAMSGSSLPGSSEASQPPQSAEVPVTKPASAPESVPTSLPLVEKDQVALDTDQSHSVEKAEGASQEMPGSVPQGEQPPAGDALSPEKASQPTSAESLPPTPVSVVAPESVADQPTLSQVPAGVPVPETTQQEVVATSQLSAPESPLPVDTVQPSNTVPEAVPTALPPGPGVEVVASVTQPEHVETELPQGGGGDAQMPELHGSMTEDAAKFQQTASTPELHPQSDAAGDESVEKYIVIDGTKIPLFDDEGGTDDYAMGGQPPSIPSPPVSETAAAFQQAQQADQGKATDGHTGAPTATMDEGSQKEDATSMEEAQAESPLTSDQDHASESIGVELTGPPADSSVEVEHPAADLVQNASGSSEKLGVTPPAVNLESTMKEIIDVYTTDDFLNRKTLSVSGGTEDKSAEQQATRMPGHQPQSDTAGHKLPHTFPPELQEEAKAEAEQTGEADSLGQEVRTEPDGSEEDRLSPSSDAEGKKTPEETQETPGGQENVTPPAMEDPNEIPPPPRAKDTTPMPFEDPFGMESNIGRRIDDKLGEEEEQLPPPPASKPSVVSGGAGYLESLTRPLLDKLPPWLQTLLEREPLGLSPHLTLLFLAVSFVSMVTITACSCCCGGSGVSTKKKNALALMRKLEEEVFVLRKEREDMEEALATAKKQVEDMDKVSRKQKGKQGVAETELQNVQLHNNALKKQVVELEQQLQEIHSEGSLAKDTLKVKDKKVKDLEKQVSQLQEQLSQVEQGLSQKVGELREREEDVQTLQSQNTALTQQVQHLETSKQQLLEQADDWKEKVTELKEQLSQMDTEFKQMQETLAFKENEQEVLRDCFLQLKAFEEHQGDEDDVDSTKSTDINEKIKAMTDVSRVNAQLIALQDDKESQDNKLRIEYEARQELEDQLAGLRREMESLQADKKKAERQCNEAQTKLTVLSNYFKEKEMQMQRELGEHEALKKQNFNRLETADERVKAIQQECELYKQQAESMKRELEASEKDFRAQIALNEKKAHENWVAARSAERELKEMRHDAAMLRQRLTDLERRPMQGPGGLIRPLPTRGMPHPGMLNGPPPPPGERGPPPPPGMERGPPPPGMERGPPPPGMERSPSRGSLPPLPPHLRDDDYGPPPDRRLPPGARIRSPPHHPDARSPPPPPYGRGPPPPMDRGTPPYRLPPGDLPPLRGPPPPHMMGSPPPLRMEPPGPRGPSPYRGPRPPPPSSKSPRQQSQV